MLLLRGLFFDHKNVGDVILPKLPLTFNELHGVIQVSQMNKLCSHVLLDPPRLMLHVAEFYLHRNNKVQAHTSNLAVGNSSAESRNDIHAVLPT
jgi:hypothetical protein